MTDIWFISDTHFNHANIIKFYPEKRPFHSIKEHDEAIVAIWNSIIRPQDKVIHLGDFYLGSHPEEYARQLHGHKYLILGNHDKAPCRNYANFTRISGGIRMRGNYFGKHDVYLSHAPIHPFSLVRAGTYNLHGHIHNHIIPDYRYINLCVEQTDLRPLHIDTIVSKMELNDGRYIS